MILLDVMMLKRPDYELILGSKKDADFGPVILFGMGGIMTEILKDWAPLLPIRSKTVFTILRCAFLDRVWFSKEPIPKLEASPGRCLLAIKSLQHMKARALVPANLRGITP